MATMGTGLRKRQQIANANRMMFFWVAGVSVVVGITAVMSLFLVQKALFNEKVLSEKSKTASTLQKNNKVVDELQSQISVLNTNDNLRGLMIPARPDEDSQPVQVVLDALPAGANSSAFGASLQQRFLKVDGVRLDSLNVAPVRDVEVASSKSSRKSSSSSSKVSEYQVQFDFTVSTNSDNVAALKDILVQLERSIRPITLTSATIEARGNQLSLRAEGYTYYQPAKSVDLKDKVIKP